MAQEPVPYHGNKCAKGKCCPSSNPWYCPQTDVSAWMKDERCVTNPSACTMNEEDHGVRFPDTERKSCQEYDAGSSWGAPCTAAEVLQQISECKTKEKEFIRQAAEQEKKIETMKETDPNRYAQCKAALETLKHQVLDKTRRTFRFLVMIMEPSGHSRGGGEPVAL